MADELPIIGTAELFELHHPRVGFRYSIDEAWPETVTINISYERWEKMGKPTELMVDVDRVVER